MLCLPLLKSGAINQAIFLSLKMIRALLYYIIKNSILTEHFCLAILRLGYGILRRPRLLKILSWTDYDGVDEEFHATKLNPRIKTFIQPHGHSFSELIFIEKGWCVQELNGKKTMLPRGSLVLLRPTIDIHSFHEYSDGVSIIRISIKQSTIEFLSSRYFKSNKVFWGEHNLHPKIMLLNEKQILWMSLAYKNLTKSQKSLLAIERFLLGLIDEVLLHVKTGEKLLEKEWIIKAYDKLQDPEYFHNGVRDISEFINRTPEHLCRMLKKHFGKTTTQIIQEAKISYACEQLAFSRKDIVDIAYECGLQSISYFYALFLKSTGTTPLEYRKRNLRNDSIFL